MNIEKEDSNESRGFEELVQRLLETLQRLVNISQNAAQSTPLHFLQGGTLNLVMNGHISQSGTSQDFNGSTNDAEAKVTSEQLKTALCACDPLIWGNAAYSVPFCVCRDDYSVENNATSFERLLAEGGIEIPEGTINNCLSRHPWMRCHIDRWEACGAKDRVLRLRDEFRQQMFLLGLVAIKAA